MTVAFTGFEASKIFEAQWAVLNDLDSDLARVGQVVTAVSGLDRTVEVSEGSTRIKGVLCQVTAPVQVQAPANGGSNPRVDALVWRVDWSAKTASLVLKQGTPASNPQPPSLTQTVNVLWEEPIADVRIGPGQGELTQPDITPRLAPVAAIYGWRPIASGDASGLTSFTIDNIPPRFHLLRLFMRGNVSGPSSPSLVGMRFNTTASQPYKYSLVEHNGAGGIETPDGGNGVSIPRIGQFGTLVGANIMVDIVDAAGGLVPSWSARGGRAGGSTNRVLAAYGRTDFNTAISSIIISHEQSGTFVNTRWWLEGYNAP